MVTDDGQKFAPIPCTSVLDFCFMITLVSLFFWTFHVYNKKVNRVEYAMILISGHDGEMMNE